MSFELMAPPIQRMRNMHLIWKCQRTQFDWHFWQIKYFSNVCHSIRPSNGATFHARVL